MEHYVAPFAASDGRNQMLETNAATERKTAVSERLRRETGTGCRDGALPHRAFRGGSIAWEEEVESGGRTF